MSGEPPRAWPPPPVPDPGPPESDVRAGVLIGCSVAAYTLGAAALPVVFMAAVWQLGSFALGTGGSLWIGLALLGGAVLFLGAPALLGQLAE